MLVKTNNIKTKKYLFIIIYIFLVFTLINMFYNIDYKDYHYTYEHSGNSTNPFKIKILPSPRDAMNIAINEIYYKGNTGEYIKVHQDKFVYVVIFELTPISDGMSYGVAVSRVTGRVLKKWWY